jgi:hypothetical protein
VHFEAAAQRQACLASVVVDEHDFGQRLPHSLPRVPATGGALTLVPLAERGQAHEAGVLPERHLERRRGGGAGPRAQEDPALLV